MTDRDKAFEEHRKEQMLRLARSTTPTQRVQIVEQMLKLMLAAGRDPRADKERMERLLTQQETT